MPAPGADDQREQRRAERRAAIVVGVRSRSSAQISPFGAQRGAEVAAHDVPEPVEVADRQRAVEAELGPDALHHLAVGAERAALGDDLRRVARGERDEREDGDRRHREDEDRGDDPAQDEARHLTGSSYSVAGSSSSGTLRPCAQMRCV